MSQRIILTNKVFLEQDIDMSSEVFLCHKNHLDFSWTGKERDFQLRWQRCESQPGTFKEECLRAAQLIFQRTDKKIAILMSGGIDCEIIARSFLELGIPFVALSYRFKAGSDHDIRHAAAFCGVHNIQHDILDFDEVSFVENEIFSLAEDFQCPDPYPLFEIERFKRAAPFFPIFGNGEPTLRYNHDQDGAYLSESGSDYVVWQWQRQTKQEGCYNFFKYTPELFNSFLLDPITQVWMNKAAELDFDEFSWKYYLYKKHWPDLEKRQKWNGYERMAGLYFKTEEYLKKMWQYEGEFTVQRYSDFKESMGVV